MLPIEQVIGREVVYNDSLHVSMSGIIKDRKETTDFPYKEFISLASARYGFLQRSLGLDRDQWKGIPFSSRVLLKLDRKADPATVNTALSNLFN